MEVIQQIWQGNKRFLLMAGGGFALFLILKGCIVEKFVDHAGTIHGRNQETERRINDLRNQLVQRYPEEKKNLTELEAIEKEVSERYLTLPPTDIPDPRRGSPQIQFSERIDRIWSELRKMANQRNVKIPEKITTNDLGVYPDDAPADHERSTSYLEILDRALKSCVDAGIRRIDKPGLYPEEVLPIPENEGILVVYRRVGLTVYGPYPAFKELLRKFQNPKFVQARLISLDTKTGGESGLLRGQVEFVGIHMEKEVEEGGEPGSPVKKSTRRKGWASTRPGGGSGSSRSGSSGSRWRN